MINSRLCRGVVVGCWLLQLGLEAVQAHSPGEEMRKAAVHWLASLTPAQRAKATFPFDEGERLNWHYIPKRRNGLPFKEMTPAQRHLAYGLLSSGLSHRGYLQATTIMSLEQILKDLGDNPSIRDPELYYFSIFGTPGATDTWGWRVEGHHVSVHFNLVDGQIAGTPSFLGSNPAEVRQGPRKGLRVLAAEEDLGRELVQSLTAAQRKVAIIQSDAPRDIITRNRRKVNPLKPWGLARSQMTAAQKELLTHLVKEYVQRNRTEIADQDLAKIEKAGWDKVHFAWAGGLESGQGHYYRVQGPTFLMEYDNTQNHANHIHAVWRDFNGDFGEDLLREHYLRYHHAR